jgi:signal transduction histidine kinase
VSVRSAVRSRAWTEKRRLRQPAKLAALVAAYFLAAQVGYALDIAGPVAAIVWLPAGVGIAFLVLGGVQLWPGVLIGDLLVNDYTALPVGTAIAQSLGNVLEVTVAALLIRRIAARRPPLATLGGLGRLLLAIAVGTAVSATVGVTAQVFGDVIEAGAAPGVWRTWWLGDTAGAVVVVPLALAWSTLPPRDRWRARLPEAAVLFVAVTVAGELIFRTDRPLTYLAFPGLIWAALRFGQRGATLAVAITVWSAAWNTAHYVGPFVFQSAGHRVVMVQLFIIVAATTTLALAAVVSEREAAARRLKASRARLVDAADTERRRLERDLHDGAQQRLIALGTQLQLAADGAGSDPERTSAALDRARTQLELAVQELRDLARGIHPAVLSRWGLARAVESLAVRSVVPIRLGPLPTVRLDDAVEVTAYYVIVEAVTNTHKHAGAATIWIRGAVSDGMLRVEVADDGSGGADASAGSGLRGLRDRVEAVGGGVAIDSAGGRGTHVVAWMPAMQRR